MELRKSKNKTCRIIIRKLLVHENSMVLECHRTELIILSAKEFEKIFIIAYS
jgi:hypothetical protein